MGPHSCIWRPKYNCEAPGGPSVRPLLDSGGEDPGKGPPRPPPGVGGSNSLAPALHIKVVTKAARLQSPAGRL